MVRTYRTCTQADGRRKTLSQRQQKTKKHDAAHNLKPTARTHITTHAANDDLNSLVDK
jgi:hypothetical protein